MLTDNQPLLSRLTFPSPLVGSVAALETGRGFSTTGCSFLSETLTRAGCGRLASWNCSQLAAFYYCPRPLPPPNSHVRQPPHLPFTVDSRCTAPQYAHGTVPDTSWSSPACTWTPTPRFLTSPHSLASSRTSSCCKIFTQMPMLCFLRLSKTWEMTRTSYSRKSYVPLPNCTRFSNRPGSKIPPGSVLGFHVCGCPWWE